MIKAAGLCDLKRWEEGIPHHPLSERLMKFISQHDYTDRLDVFQWKTGGDGDNGEELMYEMDPFFEFLQVYLEVLGQTIAEEVAGVMELTFPRGKSYTNSPKHTLAIMIEEAIKKALKGDS